MIAKPLCDRGLALARQAGRGRRAPWALAATILASGLDFVDGSVVNVGLPAIGRSFVGDGVELPWVVNGYLLPLAALLLLGGGLGDRFGRRRLLVIGILAFAVGSAACATAPSLAWLIGARAFQGVAAAMMLPNSLAILGGVFEGEARNRAIGIWAAAGSIAGAIGPVLGGWTIDTIGWRAIFLINLPLAAIAIGLASYAIDAEQPGPARAPLDLRGATLVTAALAALVWGLTQGSGAGGWRAPEALAVALGFALLAGFVWVERQAGDAAMTPLALFGARPLVALNLLTLLLYGALGAFMLLLPYVLINVFRYPAAAAGAALLPLSAILGLVSPLAGAFAGRFGARAPLIAGAALVAAGLGLALLIRVGGGYWTSVLPSIVAVALGISLAAAPLTAAVLGAVDERHTGAASGLNSAVAQLGGVIAIALAGGVLTLRGAALVGGFHAVAVCGALAALAAGACIALFYRGLPAGPTATGDRR